MDAGNRAASVAEELLAFYREPALRRTRYLHGEDPMPEGPVVLRLALGRYPEALDGLSQAHRAELRQAATAFVRLVCLWDRASHYQVLCLEPDAAAESVKESYHLLIALLHPDRRDDAWPADGAQRANQAYAVLGDPARRSDYDRQLARGPGGSAAEARAQREPARPRRRRRVAGMARRFVVVAGVLAALFVVQAWWVDEVTPEQSLLARAMPASGRWMRDMLPDAPRFLGTAFDFGERLPEIEPPRRTPMTRSWAPSHDVAQEIPPAPPAAPAPAVPARIPETAVVRTAESVLPAARLSLSTSAGPVRLAQAAPAVPATTAPAQAGGAPSRDQVESLVALLVSYYDAGDAPRLVALFDPDRLGFWSGQRTRWAYAEFFDATRQRRLRMERLTWQANGTLAQARGEATILAEYSDGRSRLERRVPIELDIALTGGEPRIARLVLFPLGS